MADLVLLHMQETSGGARQFFVELATCFTPHVRSLRRLFSGWGRATTVGSKGSKAGELSQLQFMRLCMEVGLAKGKDKSEAGKQMTRRSGARLLSVNDVDRIFLRANIDSSDTAKMRGAARGGLDRAQIAEIAVATLDELSTSGWFLEIDPGEVALREKLTPLFNAADKDGSGSVSVDEVGQMVEKLKIEAKPAELKRLVAEADADGSGELDLCA